MAGMSAGRRATDAAAHAHLRDDDAGGVPRLHYRIDDDPGACLDRPDRSPRTECAPPASSTVSLLFTNARDPLSLAIRAFTWSKWSHVALIDGYCAIEALAPDGVVMNDTEHVLLRDREFTLVDLPCRNPEAVRAAAASQVGKPYDYTALLGLALRRNWQEADAWFCSELIAWAFEQAGEPLFRADCLRRVTPQHLWMLGPAINQYQSVGI